MTFRKKKDTDEESDLKSVYLNYKAKQRKELGDL